MNVFFEFFEVETEEQLVGGKNVKIFLEVFEVNRRTETIFQIFEFDSCNLMSFERIKGAYPP